MSTSIISIETVNTGNPIIESGKKPLANVKVDSEVNKCAPSKTFQDGSCIPLYLLVLMADNYNKMYPDNKITLNRNTEVLHPNKYKQFLVGEFQKRLKKVCDDQKCWVKQDFLKGMDKKVKYELQKQTFKPVGPNGKWEWLNTIHINDVMSQYMQKYPDYLFIGAVPIDFDDLPEYGIKNMDINDLIKKGKTQLGFVFNLDEHWKSGSHWVGMYVNLKKAQVYFFDSYGMEPDKRIKALMKRFNNYFKAKGITPDVDSNDTRYQFGGSECGVYSIHFILRMLEGTTMAQVREKPISDNDINKFRAVYFIKDKK